MATSFNAVIYDWTRSVWAFNRTYAKSHSDLTCNGATCTLLTDDMIFANGSYSVYVNAIGANGASVGGAFNNGYGKPTDPTNTSEPGDFVYNFARPALVDVASMNAAPNGTNVNVTWESDAGTIKYYVWLGTANAGQTNY